MLFMGYSIWTTGCVVPIVLQLFINMVGDKNHKPTECLL